MGEKWRRVDDEEDDDEVHLNIQEGKWWSRGDKTTCGGVAFQSPPPETAGGAPLGSPTTIGCEEEGGKGVVSTTSPPPLPPPRRLAGGRRPSDQPLGSLQRGPRWREVRRAAAWRGVLPSTIPTRGEHGLPFFFGSTTFVDRSAVYLFRRARPLFGPGSGIGSKWRSGPGDPTLGRGRVVTRHVSYDLPCPINVPNP
ncbi:hypothetical protein Sjap_005205 [Stephania japonica]|uniref:Uncharacterized protein n=1 Tax=Stephania japonica TaxID=461633 RepID=A0AAP0K3M6_9MAGN